MTKSANARAMLEMGRDLSSDEYKEVVAELLGGVDSYKELGTPLYLAVCQHCWGIYFESVALRNNANGILKVFMTKRDETDPDWQGYWHVPGTALRYGDTHETAVARLAKEYGVPIVSFERVDDAGVGFFKKGDTGRGPGMSLIHVTKLNGEPALNKRRGWFDVRDLPVPTVPSHVSVIIPRANQAYSRIEFSEATGGR